MSYSYSNPFAPAAPPGLRSTFTAGLGHSGQKHQVLFSGLPPDVAERDLREILVGPPLSLPSSTTELTCFYSPDKTFTGTAMVGVGHAVDAERIRLEYSGQLIDNTYRLIVQHVLPPTQSNVMDLPVAQAHQQPAPQSQPAPQTSSRTQQQQQQRNAPASAPRGPAKASTSKPAPKAAAKEERAPGLTLLARIKNNGKGGASTNQAALLARQKANMKKTPNDLLSRLAKQQRTTPAQAKAKIARTASTGGAQKVNRAKSNANKNGMDLDEPAGGKAKAKDVKEVKEKPKVKTQAELDAEMLLWERQRRFAA